MTDRPNDTSNIAVFFDLENVAVGTGDQRFEVQRVLDRLLEIGNVIFKKAYADWQQYAAYKRPFHEAGIELIDIPTSSITGKNSADIKMVVDAMELSYTKPHLDVFALVSGDSDFSPLVSKLRENGKHVVGVGVKKSSSRLLIDNCDEFVFYEELVPTLQTPAERLADLSRKKRRAFEHVLDAASALLRDGRELHGSLVKTTVKRKHPQFTEQYHGYSTFGRLLKDVEKHGLIKLERDDSGNLKIAEIVE